MRKKRILITGGAGFIGSNLARLLVREGHEVICVDNLITSSSRNIHDLKQFDTFTFIKHDITKPFTSVQKKRIGNVEQIYHLACPTGVPNLVPLAEEVLMTCTIGTRNILEFARKQKASLLFTSSSEVYGNPKSSPQDESYTGNVDTLGDRSVYEEGKRVSETMIRMYVKKYNLDGKIVRVFNTFGPHMDTSDSRVIPYFLSRLLYNEPLPVQGDGAQTRTFCYVDDLVEGLILVMNKGEKGTVYNLGSDKEINISSLAKLLIELNGKGGETTHAPRPDHDHDARHPDISKVRKLGWSPSVTFEEGLKNTMIWYGL